VVAVCPVVDLSSVGGGCIFPPVVFSPRQTKGGRRERYGPGAPPSEIVLDWDSSPTLSQMNSSQLSSFACRFGRSFLLTGCGARGARSGDGWIFELKGRSVRVGNRCRNQVNNEFMSSDVMRS